jgi:hypothetical protein
MSKMRTKLTYHGDTPVHTFSRVWSKGTSRGLDELFTLVQRKYKRADAQPDEEFANWFFNTYVQSLGREWEFTIDATDFEENVIIQGDLTVGDPDTAAVVRESISLEAEDVEIASSQEEAMERLKQMRHPKAVGEIVREEVKPSTNKTLAEKAKDMPKLDEGRTMTGDDLARMRGEQEPSSAILNSETAVIDDPAAQQETILGGRVLKESDLEAAGTSNFSFTKNPKEEQELYDAKMANLSKKASILVPEDLQDASYQSMVVTGDQMDSSEDGVKDVAQEVPGLVNPPLSSRKVNEHFKGYSGVGTQAREITIDDIARNPDQKFAIQLVEKCKDRVVLKTARNSCYTQGKQKLVEAIDRRLHRL